jgi:predicted RNA binding protein YcfA (HicA-like mRNA interferase family)
LGGGLVKMLKNGIALLKNTGVANLAKRDVSSKVIREFLKNEGGEEIRKKGSHGHYILNGSRITLPEHGNKDIAEGTLASIGRQIEKAGITKEDFKNAIGRGR